MGSFGFSCRSCSHFKIVAVTASPDRRHVPSEGKEAASNDAVADANACRSK